MLRYAAAAAVVAMTAVAGWLVLGPSATLPVAMTGSLATPAWSTPEHRFEAAAAASDGVTQADPAAAPVATVASAVGPAVLVVTAPRSLQVGEMRELVLDVDAARDGLGELSFSVQFDPHLLQVRAGLEGDGSAVPGRPRDFVAEIAPAEDRIRIRSRVGGAGLSGRVAIIQFQAVAPGSTSVIVTDASAVDRTGRPITARVLGAFTTIAIESPPAPTAHAPAPAVADGPASTVSSEGD